MKDLNRKEIIESLQDPIFNIISNTADEIGVECYVIGGWVRDLFLQRQSKDIDVVVVNPNISRPGIVLAEAIAAKFPDSSLSIYQNFGTAQLKIDNNEVEFVGARKESYDRGSRKPITEDGSIKEDQDRRDFTINALAICLNKDRFGELLDPFNGLSDMKNKVIRTPLDPKITFSDDPLRMMRCVRFATQLSFNISDETFNGLKVNKERIKIISVERITDELNKIISSKNPSIGFKILDKCELLSIIFPELSALKGVDIKNGIKHKDNFYHTLEVLDNVANYNGSLWLRWAALLHDIGKPKSKKWSDTDGWTFYNHNLIGEKMIPNIFKHLKLPLYDKLQYVQKLVNLHMRPIVIANEAVTDSAIRRLIFDAGPDIDDLMILCTSDITSKNLQKKEKFIKNFELVKEKIANVNEADRIRLFQPIIDGNEIMEMFNLKPCRLVGILKNALKDAQLNMEIEDTYESAKEFLNKKAKELNIL